MNISGTQSPFYIRQAYPHEHIQNLSQDLSRILKEVTNGNFSSASQLNDIIIQLNSLNEEPNLFDGVLDPREGVTVYLNYLWALDSLMKKPLSYPMMHIVHGLLFMESLQSTMITDKDLEFINVKSQFDHTISSIGILDKTGQTYYLNVQKTPLQIILDAIFALKNLSHYEPELAALLAPLGISDLELIQRKKYYIEKLKSLMNLPFVHTLSDFGTLNSSFDQLIRKREQCVGNYDHLRPFVPNFSTADLLLFKLRSREDFDGEFLIQLNPRISSTLGNEGSFILSRPVRIIPITSPYYALASFLHECGGLSNDSLSTRELSPIRRTICLCIGEHCNLLAPSYENKMLIIFLKSLVLNVAKNAKKDCTIHFAESILVYLYKNVKNLEEVNDLNDLLLRIFNRYPELGLKKELLSLYNRFSAVVNPRFLRVIKEKINYDIRRFMVEISKVKQDEAFQYIPLVNSYLPFFSKVTPQLARNLITAVMRINPPTARIGIDLLLDAEKLGLYPLEIAIKEERQIVHAILMKFDIDDKKYFDLYCNLVRRLFDISLITSQNHMTDFFDAVNKTFMFIAIAYTIEPNDQLRQNIFDLVDYMNKKLFGLKVTGEDLHCKFIDNYTVMFQQILYNIPPKRSLFKTTWAIHRAKMEQDGYVLRTFYDIFPPNSSPQKTHRTLQQNKWGGISFPNNDFFSRNIRNIQLINVVFPTFTIQNFINHDKDFILVAEFYLELLEFLYNLKETKTNQIRLQINEYCKLFEQVFKVELSTVTNYALYGKRIEKILRDNSLQTFKSNTKEDAKQKGSTIGDWLSIPEEYKKAIDRRVFHEKMAQKANKHATAKSIRNSLSAKQTKLAELMFS